MNETPPPISSLPVAEFAPKSPRQPDEDYLVDGFGWLLVNTFLSPMSIATAVWYLIAPEIGFVASLILILTLVSSMALYAIIWIPTLILHFRLRSLAKNPVSARLKGFDVLVKPIAAIPVQREGAN